MDWLTTINKYYTYWLEKGFEDGTASNISASYWSASSAGAG